MLSYLAHCIKIAIENFIGEVLLSLIVAIVALLFTALLRVTGSL